MQLKYGLANANRRHIRKYSYKRDSSIHFQQLTEQGREQMLTMKGWCSIIGQYQKKRCRRPFPLNEIHQ
jgi:hypothetical protein